MLNVIYKIRNVVNNKFYVGSTQDARVRFQTHKRRLRKGKHQSPYMQASWDKYGEDCFKFEVVERVDNPEGLLAAEQVWLDEHAGKPHCYNCATNASAPMKGKKHSKEVKEKLRVSATLKSPRGKESHLYGKRPSSADKFQKPIHAILPDNTVNKYVSLTIMRDTLGVDIATIIRACKSGKPVKRGTIAGWVLSYDNMEHNKTPDIPNEYVGLPRTRQAAKLLNTPLYFTGMPCSRGHVSTRKLTGVCVACCKADYKKYNDRKKK